MIQRPLIMGILNVTPDSFSDGGQFTSSQAIRKQIDALMHDGADIIDVGGESSRPFAAPVSAQEELNRVIPAIKAIRENYPVPISIDTTKSEVARAALDAGADIINDISAFRFDPAMVTVAKHYEAPVIIMHMQGTPGNMQVAPHYDDIIEETIAFFQDRITWLEESGIDRSKITIDPGLGFGKTVAHNLTILKNIAAYQVLGCPVLVGHSRKSFIGKVLGNEVQNRDLATAILSGFLAAHDVAVLRVHDVASTSQAIRLTQAVLSA